ncbi:hypothetical protein Pmar_PMAR017929 [Perkinsus marinus ATCC 50983]|uniref:Uncharacterized protein n=1 Tax=Perkinsus marinus (strain ATCC 50983 / TXsc) TaxID=423536 RepID=C5LIB0_PERM5|nr:hypothetical protein Pmar_PMAR017929 [Perkinsus marinus ATCC 50983]EER03526.1 hypothetical protein Pmar_PMAR017929 [Perkinsus marinus ATCC 50983]|eukprot:XP_002771710.1 hypothetical protein Pmar_PMAR017929 [Perkinsus marinus ATCC 50983]
MEMQRLYLEVEKRDAFNKEVSIMRAKLQRWASKTEIVDVEEKARVIYGAVIDAAQVEGMSIEWPINRHEDLHNALELFLVGKTGEMGSGDGSGGGVKAAFHAWKGTIPTPSHELLRRFLIKEQEKDPLCKEVRQLLNEGADLSKKWSVSPAVFHYGENVFLQNGVLCKKDPVDDEDDVRISVLTLSAELLKHKFC